MNIKRSRAGVNIKSSSQYVVCPGFMYYFASHLNELRKICQLLLWDVTLLFHQSTCKSSNTSGGGVGGHMVHMVTCGLALHGRPAVLPCSMSYFTLQTVQFIALQFSCLLQQDQWMFTQVSRNPEYLSSGVFQCL